MRKLSKVNENGEGHTTHQKSPACLHAKPRKYGSRNPSGKLNLTQKLQDTIGRREVENKTRQRLLAEY